MRHVSALGFALSASLAACALVVGCGSAEESVFVAPAPDAGPAPEEIVDPDFGSYDEEGNRATGCRNLACKQQVCPEGSAAETTTIRGQVFDPRGVNPLYNALVYVANGKVQDFDDNQGVTCDRCNGAQATGDPLVSDLTKSDGSFELKDVPVGVDLPIVIQLGKWRRIITLPAVEACKVTDITDPQVFRLPRNKSEGHIPRMAVALGGADPFECLLRKIGIDDAEFTNPEGDGRVHTYRAADYSGSSATHAAYAYGAAAEQRMPLASSLLGDKTQLSKYDVALLPCEGTPNNSDKTAQGAAQSQATYDNFRDYLNLGGRAFVTHYSKTFIEGHRNGNAGPIDIPSHFGATGSFNYVAHDRSDARTVLNADNSVSWSCLEGQGCPSSGRFDLAADAVTGNVDKSFPKGLAFQEWLAETGASSVMGQLPITEWRHNLESVNPAYAQSWIVADSRTAWPLAASAAHVKARNIVQHMTFNVPLDATTDANGDTNACGKIVYSDFHVAELVRNRASYFPASCGNAAAPMTAQEKALEFMLFDLSACIQKEDAPPHRPK